ncbi:YqhR family membrane protein [Geobacillus sp. YF-1]|uniref:YqhR family membrane protein n=1 Tax=Geobacillus sp. YF-1 TaxID=3457480 RepID=UPI004045F595
MMAQQNGTLEQEKTERPMTLIQKTIIIGFVGGVFWSLIGYLAYFFNFSDISPNMILIPWVAGDWKYGKAGNYAAVVLIGILSIGAALLYYALLRNVRGMWAGMVYGAGLWAVVFYLFHPLFFHVQPVAKLDANTVITTLCLYILYGVFVGYSISFEAQEMNQPSASEGKEAAKEGS